MKETVLEQEFEIVRAIVATAVCILIGFATDFSMKFWNKTASKNKDVQKSLVRKGLFFMYLGPRYWVINGPVVTCVQSDHMQAIWRFSR